MSGVSLTALTLPTPVQVVGAFLEGGSNEENAALKKVAQTNPAAPDDLGTQGLEFASKL